MVQQRHRETGDGYKLIMMDFEMPVCNGPPAAKAIIEYLSVNASSLAKPYICCLSAYEAQCFKDEAYAAGMDDYFSKNISEKVLK